MAAQWREGIWLGKSWSSDEHLVGSDHGTVLIARSIKQSEQKGTHEDLLKIVHVDERRAHSENTFWIPLAERSTPHVDLIVLNGP